MIGRTPKSSGQRCACVESWFEFNETCCTSLTCLCMHKTEVHTDDLVGCGLFSKTMKLQLNPPRLTKRKKEKNKLYPSTALFSSRACRLKFCNILLPNFAPHIELQLARKFCHEPTTSFTAAHSELKFPGMGDRCKSRDRKRIPRAGINCR
jgi:hypothetical protein